MRDAPWTTHPRPRRIDDITQLASSTTQIDEKPHARPALTPDEKGSASPLPQTPRGSLACMRAHTYRARLPLALTPSRPLSLGVFVPEVKPWGATSRWWLGGARGLRVPRRAASRRRSPMAGVRWGEASKPGPRGAGGGGAEELVGHDDEPGAACGVWDDSAPLEVEEIPTTDVEPPEQGSARAQGLRAPLSLHHLFCAGVGGFTGAMAAGFEIVGGCDASSRARETFTDVTRAPTVSRVEDVEWSAEPPDVVLATPPTEGLSAGKSVGAETAAAQAISVAVQGIIASGALVGIIETTWEVTTAQSGGLYRRILKQAARENYSSHFRYASPHRVGGAEVRTRLFLLFVRDAVIRSAGPLPLLPLARGGVPTRTVRSCLDLDQPRAEITVGPIRWRKVPKRVGAAVVLGHYGRGGKGDADLAGCLWSIDACAPPVDSQVIYCCDGRFVQLTPRERARVRGIPDSVDIGEATGPRHAHQCVSRSPSSAAMWTVLSVVRDYLHEARSAARDAGGEARPEAVTVEAEASPLMRRFSDGSPQWCSAPACRSCDRANSTLVRPDASGRTCADAFRLLAGAVYLRRLRREGGAMWEPNGERRDSGVGSRPRRYAGPLRPQSLTVMVAQGEHREHARVCQKVNATWHGFRYVYSELGGDPYRAVESRPCQMRSMNFWRFPANGFSAKFREWSRLGSPAFRAHEWHDPTKDGNYDSGDGEQAANFIQDMVIDGILIPVAKEKVEVMIRSQQAAINPIATIPKATPGQFRFLIDSRRAGTNWMLAKMPSHFPEPLHAIHCVVPKGGYTFSSDMRDCFFSFPLNEQDSWLFVVEFRGEFYRYGQLAQGSKTSPHACLGFGYAQIELFRDQRGCHQVIEQLPGAKSFDVSVPAVQFVDDNGRIDAISLHGRRYWRGPHV